MPNLTANYNFKKPLGTEKMDVNVLNENFDNIDEEIFKINNSKGKVNGIATLDENGRIPQSQIGIRNGVDVIFKHSAMETSKVTIENIPNNYKYYEIYAYGQGAYMADNVVKVNNLEITKCYTSSQNDFIHKVIISNKAYGYSDYNNYDEDMTDVLCCLGEGVDIGETLNVVEIDCNTSSTAGIVKKALMLGYR